MGVYTTINDGTAHFQGKIYSGTGSSHAITYDGNSAMKPDLCVGRKITASGDSWYWVDSTRGASARIMSDNANGQDGNGLTSFNTDGFTTSLHNSSGQNYINYGWKANGAIEVQNTDGTITATTQQVNSTAKFSLTRYTGNSTAGATVGHGLGVAPEAIFIKKTSAADDWACWQTIIGGSTLRLNENSGENDSKWSGFFNSTTPGTSVVTLGSDNQVNGSGTYMMYCWTSVQGFSSFGKYTGNGSADGPFIYTGFKPAMVFNKVTNSDASGNWRINDRYNDPFNVVDIGNNLNENVANFTQNTYDFLSNGFKVIDTGGANTDGKTFAYWAWAENPFVSSAGVPTTAR